MNNFFSAASPFLSFESDRFRIGSKESIEDTMSRKEMGSNYDRSLSEVFQSLILPPSYSGLSKSGVLEVRILLREFALKKFRYLNFIWIQRRH